MRVLLLADDCNPQLPSLPVVGYKLCRALGDRVEATVATQIRNRNAIDQAGFGACQVEYLDNSYIANPLFKFNRRIQGGQVVSWTTTMALKYPSTLAFEHEAWKRFGGDLKAGRFDLVHRVTPMSPTLPSPMARWSPVPFVLGPLNGGLRWPAQFRSELAKEREWLTYVRGAYRWLPYYGSTYRRSAAVLAGFDHTIADLPRSAQGRTINFAEVGYDPSLFGSSPRVPRRPGERLTLLYAGRLVPYKCPDVAIRVMAASPSLRRHRLRIVGDGHERPRLEAMVAEHGLSDCVEFVGKLDQAGVGREMRQADIFLFPTIRELGAGALVEAMACGLACAVVDYGAPASLIDASRGIKVPLGTKDEITQSLVSALEPLVEDPTRVAALGESARSYVETYYTWAARASFIIEVYRWVLGQRPDQPVFPLTSSGAVVGAGV
jgi:glycosyltransferase involved in cell wall biosynthesis